MGQNGYCENKTAKRFLTNVEQLQLKIQYTSRHSIPTAPNDGYDIINEVYYQCSTMGSNRPAEYPIQDGRKTPPFTVENKPLTIQLSATITYADVLPFLISGLYTDTLTYTIVF